MDGKRKQNSIKFISNFIDLTAKQRRDPRNNQSRFRDSDANYTRLGSVTVNS